MSVTSKRSRELAERTLALPNAAIRPGREARELAREVQRLDAALTRSRDALVALWTDRRSDKHAELYAEAMAALNEWVPQEC